MNPFKFCLVALGLLAVFGAFGLAASGANRERSQLPAGVSLVARDATGNILPVGVEPPRPLTFHGMTLYAESPWQVVARDKAGHNVWLKACSRGSTPCSELLLSTRFDTSKYHCVSRHRPCKGALLAGSGHLVEYSEVLRSSGSSKVYRLWEMGDIIMMTSDTYRESVNRMFASIVWPSRR